MNKGLSIALLIVGIILLVFGFNASDSIGSELSEAVQGAPSDKSIWLIVLGVLAAVGGGIGLMRRGA
ncbi:MAG TPA: DUF3185 family protein [Opitutaceae bacterium]